MIVWIFRQEPGIRIHLVYLIMNLETFKRRPWKFQAHVPSIKYLINLGKLTRNEVMKDSVEIEAFSESLSKPDTINT